MSQAHWLKFERSFAVFQVCDPRPFTVSSSSRSSTNPLSLPFHLSILITSSFFKVSFPTLLHLLAFPKSFWYSLFVSPFFFGLARSCVEIFRMPAPTALKSTKANATFTPFIHSSPTAKTYEMLGGGRANGFHSDDEIEREARSNSDTDEDDQSSVDSETDSETEPASEDVPHDGHPALLSPGTTPPVIDGSKDDDNHAPLLAASVNWSEMVADEVANGTTELPVVDFADLDASVIHAKPPRAPVPRRAPKSKRPVPHRHSSEPVAIPTSSGPSPEPPIPSTAPEEPISHVESKPTSPSAPHRRGRTARQVYQERLENDPSYVPTVGGFWGRDDRLMDKGLRPLFLNGGVNLYPSILDDLNPPTWRTYARSCTCRAGGLVLL